MVFCVGGSVRLLLGVGHQVRRDVPCACPDLEPYPKRPANDSSERVGSVRLAATDALRKWSRLKSRRWWRHGESGAGHALWYRRRLSGGLFVNPELLSVIKGFGKIHT